MFEDVRVGKWLITIFTDWENKSVLNIMPKVMSIQKY
jgi:hypothetical protein